MDLYKLTAKLEKLQTMFHELEPVDQLMLFEALVNTTANAKDCVKMYFSRIPRGMDTCTNWHPGDEVYLVPKYPPNRIQPDEPRRATILWVCRGVEEMGEYCDSFAERAIYGEGDENEEFLIVSFGPHTRAECYANSEMPERISEDDAPGECEECNCGCGCNEELSL
jgi:hypothetical protein